MGSTPWLYASSSNSSRFGSGPTAGLTRGRSRASPNDYTVRRRSATSSHGAGNLAGLLHVPAVYHVPAPPATGLRPSSGERVPTFASIVPAGTSSAYEP